MVSLQHFVFVLCAVVAVSAGLDLKAAQEKTIIPGEYIIQFNKDIPSATIENILLGTDVLGRIEVGRNKVVLIKTNSNKIISLISKSQLVDIIEPNREVELFHPVEFRDGSYPAKPISERVASNPNADICQEQSGADDNIWHLIRTSHDAKPDYAVNPYLFEHQGEGVNMYIIDSGVDIAHPDFEGRAIWGMTAGQLYNREGHYDMNGHGTNVASLAAGKTWGIAKKATIISAKSLGGLGGGNIFNIIESIDWCTDHHVAEKEAGNKPRGIINMSLGSPGPSPVMETAVDAAHDAGITVIAAAGNSNANTNLFSPAGFDSSIAVGATAEDDMMATFSNWGCRVAVNAPGVLTKAAWSNNSSYCEENSPGAMDCLRVVSGTSMAAPVAAGVAARYISTTAVTDEEYEAYTPETMLKILTATATRDRLQFNSDEQATTTNRIVYKGCGGLSWDPEDVFIPCRDDDPAPPATTTLPPTTTTDGDETGGSGAVFPMALLIISLLAGLVSL